MSNQFINTFLCFKYIRSAAWLAGQVTNVTLIITEQVYWQDQDHIMTFDNNFTDDLMLIEHRVQLGSDKINVKRDI